MNEHKTPDRPVHCNTNFSGKYSAILQLLHTSYQFTAQTCGNDKHMLLYAFIMWNKIGYCTHCVIAVRPNLSCIGSLWKETADCYVHYVSWHLYRKYNKSFI